MTPVPQGKKYIVGNNPSIGNKFAFTIMKETPPPRVIDVDKRGGYDLDPLR